MGACLPAEAASSTALKVPLNFILGKAFAEAGQLETLSGFNPRMASQNESFNQRT